jgi:RimJ/RimL family protein N-acetyltransferase
VERHLPPALTLETDRLSGEPVGPQHLDALCALFGDPRVAATLGGVQERAEVAARLDTQIAAWARDGFGPRAWRDRTSGEIVARGGLASAVLDREPVVEIGWAVVAERWGEGIATELGAASVGEAATLGIPEVVAFTLPHNTASRRVMEKLGMAYDRVFEHAMDAHVLYRLAL